MDLRLLIEPQEGASYEDQLEVAQLAEVLGFQGFFRTDHYLPLGLGPSDAPRASSDAWITLAALARETTRIRLGTLVTAATFRHPGPLAMAVSQVDAMSGGRVELGIGAGWFEPEHRAFGIPFPDLKTRFDRLDEQLEIFSRYWSTAPGQTFSFYGEHFQLIDCPALPRPSQNSGPPVILGGKGKPRTLRLAARWAAEFNLEFPRPGVPGIIRRDLLAACESAGRDPDSLIYSAAHLACVGVDETDLLRRAERAGLDLSLKLGGLIGTIEQVRDDLTKLE